MTRILAAALAVLSVAGVPLHFAVVELLVVGVAALTFAVLSLHTEGDRHG